VRGRSASILATTLVETLQPKRSNGKYQQRAQENRKSVFQLPVLDLADSLLSHPKGTHGITHPANGSVLI
jgi:hypothetical protein